MKSLNIILLGFTLSFGMANAAESKNTNSEQECGKSVDVVIDYIETLNKQTGAENKLVDLTVGDIRKMQKSTGNCKTMDEINKRKNK